jgi:hypothetical protein
MVKRKYGKKIKLDVTNITADGDYVEEYLKKFSNGEVLKINKVLYVHN